MELCWLVFQDRSSCALPAPGWLVQQARNLGTGNLHILMCPKDPERDIQRTLIIRETSMGHLLKKTYP